MTSEGHPMTTGWIMHDTDEESSIWYALDPTTGELTEHTFASKEEAHAFRDAQGVALWRAPLSTATPLTWEWVPRDGD